MNIDKLVDALDSIIGDVSDKANANPIRASSSTSDVIMWHKELGKVEYANTILPKIQFLKSIVSETEVYKELKRSYKGSDGTVLEEYILGNGSGSAVVVYLDYTETKSSFNVILKQIMESDA